MGSGNFSNCLDSINKYFKNDSTGYPFFVNIDNWDDYKNLCLQLEADSSKNYLSVSSITKDDGVPSYQNALNRAVSMNDCVFTGLAQAALFKGREELKNSVLYLLNKSINNHLLVILIECYDVLQKKIINDPRVERRIFFLEGEKTPLPKLSLANDELQFYNSQVIKGIKNLLKYLDVAGNIDSDTTINVLTKFNAKTFSIAGYYIHNEKTIYELVLEYDADLNCIIKEEYGTSELWRHLLTDLNTNNSFKSVYNSYYDKDISILNHLFRCLGNKVSVTSTYENWLLWLYIKVYGNTGNKYIDYVAKDSISVHNLMDLIYFKLADIDYRDEIFSDMYKSRKYILSNLEKDKQRIVKYCNLITKYSHNEIRYLTDLSVEEKYKLIESVNLYKKEWNYEMLQNIFSSNFPELYKYMKPFIFTEYNTKISQNKSSVLEYLSTYFDEYKWLKLENYISKEFKDKVEYCAEKRIYNCLSSRSMLVNKLDKNKSYVYFFDALGVEYMSYIIEKCSELKMHVNINIGRCELPSITSLNKEFYDVFSKIDKISLLDEVKHSNLEFNYEKCKLPIHIFQELEIINDALEHIYNKLSSDTAYERIHVISDHGASRLAVINESYDKSTIELKEKGKHSGRCCPIENNPNLDFATYDNGYAVLANYERFKGSRAADVEVHGGATMEEVLVPVLSFSLVAIKPVIKVLNELILDKDKEFTLELNSDIIISEPILIVEGITIQGQHMTDKHNIKFKVHDITDSGEYTAKIYDGIDAVDSDQPLVNDINLVVTKKKLIKENDMFDF